MYNNHILPGYRKLTEYETELATKAIDWLANKHLRASHIVMITDRNIDREAKALYIRIETRHVIYYRKIRYGGSDLDKYLSDVLPYLKVEKWLFPNQGWTGRKPSFGFHIHQEAVEKYLQSERKTVLIKALKYSKIETSTKKTHIQNQIMVGRRIALRA